MRRKLIDAYLKQLFEMNPHGRNEHCPRVKGHCLLVGVGLKLGYSGIAHLRTFE